MTEPRTTDTDTALRTADVLWTALRDRLEPEQQIGFGRLYEQLYGWMLDRAAAATPSLDVRGPQAIEALDRIQRAVLLMGRVAAGGTLVTESVVVDEAREALRDFHAAARLDEGSKDSGRPSEVATSATPDQGKGEPR